MLRAFAHHVVCCCVLLDEVWNWSNFRANKCQHFYCFAVIEAWSNNVAFVCTVHPTMLRRRTRTTCHVSTQIHANKKSTWRRRWKTSQSPLYSHLKTQHVVTCCERLHRSANIAQQETTLLGPTMLRVVASVCTGLKVVLWSKNHFLFFFRFWKRVRLTPNWQNFELWVLSKGCLFWV